jgi:UDP-N-acetylmuramyl pentapeptide phosphotransferase/UDP-N-acetylglucosamine-1-phosphate transferase
LVTGLLEGALLVVSFLLPFLAVNFGLPPYMKFLVRRGRVSDDAHKNPPVKVPEPVGPLLFLASLLGELFVALAYGSLVPVAIIIGTAIAFAIGLADDLYVLGGRTKPILLILAGLGFVGLVAFRTNIYRPVLTFPVLGDTAPHFFIYTILAIAAFPIVANAFNMMDSFNGEISSFTLLTSLALLVATALHAALVPGFSTTRVAAILPLVGVSAAFLLFNRYPSRAFDGDSGALMFGAMFAGLAITGGVEIAAMIAIVPAILNSFYTLSSVRGFVERRLMRSRPTYLGEDGMMHASVERNAPITLVRLILLGGPLAEKDLVKNVVILTGVACLLSIVISVLTWVFPI